MFESTSLDNKNNVKYATDHWYRCLGQSCEIHDLLNHKNMISDTQQHIEPTAQFFSTYKKGAVKYYLDEINVLSGTGNITFSATFATALFAVDWMMYLMSLGTVDSVNWEQVYNSNQNLWQPSTSDTLAAVTKNTYYGLIATAEFIGRGGNTKVVEIAPGGNDGTYFSSYAAYQGRKLVRVALCNLNYWDNADGTKRPVESIELQGLPRSTKSVTVKYLTNPNGAGHDATDTTYAGSQWGYDSLGKEKKGVQQTTIKVRVQGGKANIPSPDSSIAIVYM